MELRGFEDLRQQQEIPPMLGEKSSTESVAVDWQYDSRLMMIERSWAELPEHVKETIALLVVNTPRYV